MIVTTLCIFVVIWLATAVIDMWCNQLRQHKTEALKKWLRMQHLENLSYKDDLVTRNDKIGAAAALGSAAAYSRILSFVNQQEIGYVKDHRGLPIA